MEVYLQQEMQEAMLQQERLQRVRLVLLVVMQVVHLAASLLMLVLEEQLRMALKGHLEVALEGHLEVAVEEHLEVALEEEHLRVARIAEVERHLVATLELAALSPWMHPLPLTPDSPLWCLHL